MTYTIEDVGTVPMPDGSVKELSLEEKQALVNEWNIAANKKYVPIEVTMRQARLALHQQGKLTQVEEVVAQADQQTKISWEFASTVDRNSDLVKSLSPALGFTDQQLDDLFILASTL